MEIALQYISSLKESDAVIMYHYKCEMDPDDWVNAPLCIHYEVINYLLKTRYVNPTKLGYVPKLLKENVVSSQEIKTQIESAKRLKTILQGFPCASNDITVFRGSLAEDAYFVKSSSMRVGEQITIPYFLSTSLNVQTAYSFTNRNSSYDEKCIWEIVLPKIFPFTFIGGGEAEVLINIGAILECIGKDEGNRKINLKLVGFSKCVETRNFWTSIHKSV
jgi:hypothetical protein